VNGGLLQLVQPFVDYVEQKGGRVFLRTAVEGIERRGQGYAVHTAKQGGFLCRRVVSGIPINNTLPLLQGEWGEAVRRRMAPKVMPSALLNSAFQMGIGFRRPPGHAEVLHHQLHLREPLQGIGAKSIFVSFSHPLDASRADLPGHGVASVSTHVPNPAETWIADKEAVAEQVFGALEEAGLLQRDWVAYWHASTPKGWEQWTRRAWGFVGGYPQYLRIKPWQLLDARLDGQGAYLCGDTAYPGQGIPGVALSGIIAAEKLLADGLG
jgi:phytoene dehydrogenase-like protein